MEEGGGDTEPDEGMAAGGIAAGGIVEPAGGVPLEGGIDPDMAPEGGVIASVGGMDPEGGDIAPAGVMAPEGGM